MKTFWKEFGKRGLLFAWGGPAVYAIVLLCLPAAALTMREVALGILTITLLAFIAAGITAVYQIEKLPAPMAGLIHMAVLYFDYLIVYEVNGWLANGALLIFTGAFLGGFVLIWATIYFATAAKVRRMNRKLAQ